MNRVRGHVSLLKMFICAVVMFTTLTMASTDVYGYKAVRATVTVKSGKVRKDAKATAPFVFGVTKDEIVTVIGEKKDADGKLWYEIKVMNTTGYIRSDLIKKSNIEVKSESTIEIDESTKKNEAGATTANGGKTPTVKGSNVIVREEASTKSGIRIMVQKDQALNVISTSQGDDGKTWCYVSFTKGTNSYKGYIRSDLVNMEGVSVAEPQEQKDNKDKESTDNSTSNVETPAAQVGKVRGVGVNIRKEPITGTVMCQLSAGHSITVIDQVRGSDGNIWCKINFTYNKSPQTGFIRSDFAEGIELGVPSEIAAAKEEERRKEEEKKKEEEAKKQAEANKSSEPSKSTSIKGIGVRIRDKAVDGGIICQLDTGYPIEIIEEVEGSDGYKWYKIKFSKRDTLKEGYVRSDLVNIVVSQYSSAVSDEDFEKQISEFPDDYKAALRALHEKYPKWQFKPVNTGLDWNNVVAAEITVGKNLVSKSSIASWKSTAPQAYNWESNSWYGFDGGSWAAASPELIKYYLDPRNFLDDSGIFQFETLGYEDYHNEAGVSNILAGTFMKGDYADSDGTTRSYASTFCEAGKTYGISPYHLASRAAQEQGTNGTSQSISGNVSGLENIYNYFNIGAFATGSRTATINGLYYAAGNDESYLRPWNTRYKSILGSAKYISDKYVSVGQNTLYFQKFNVVNKSNGIYSHQYMSNIVAASYESARLKKAYSELNTELLFRIPYYQNMPGEKCIKPTSDSNPNTYLNTLAVDGYSFTSQFSSVNNLYYVNVDESVESVNISASPVSSSSSVSGAGNVSLNVGDNKVQVTCKAQNGSSKIYTIMIRRGQ